MRYINTLTFTFFITVIGSFLVRFSFKCLLFDSVFFDCTLNTQYRIVSYRMGNNIRLFLASVIGVKVCSPVIVDISVVC